MAIHDPRHEGGQHEMDSKLNVTSRDRFDWDNHAREQMCAAVMAVAGGSGFEVESIDSVGLTLPSSHTYGACSGTVWSPPV